MGKNIVVITGSPRKSGNSIAMTDAFIEAAKKLGHEIFRFDAVEENIHGCRACEACFGGGAACPFDERFSVIAEAIKNADAIVFTMPVYWYTIPAQIKAIIDKLFSFCTASVDVSGKKCALIACCEEDDMTVLDGVRIPLERTAALLGWEMAGTVLVPSVYKVGDIDKTDGCARAAALAEVF